MIMNNLEMHCLNAACDDYENVISIQESVNIAMHASYSKKEICQCLFQLMNKEYISAFRYDQSNQQYENIGIIDNLCDDMWFYISEKGRLALDKTWQD